MGTGIGSGGEGTDGAIIDRDARLGSGNERSGGKPFLPRKGRLTTRKATAEGDGRAGWGAIILVEGKGPGADRRWRRGKCSPPTVSAENPAEAENFSFAKLLRLLPRGGSDKDLASNPRNAHTSPPRVNRLTGKYEKH